MDLFSSDPKRNFADDKSQEHDIDPEETFARTTPVGGNRYDPSRLTPPNAVADFDLDGSMREDGAESLPGLDESYAIDETTGQRFSVSSASSSNNNSEGGHRIGNAAASFCKQLTVISTVPNLVVLSVGLLGLLYIATRPDSLATSSQFDGGSSMDILLYNTEIAVNAACTKPNANWEDLSTCRDLCRSSMCCFDLSESTSCYRGNERSCLAHSSCRQNMLYPSQIAKAYHTENQKLVLSEMIYSACSNEGLDSDMSHCQQLCNNMLCCFDEEEQYNCARAKTEECVVHAACAALIGER